jgi:hypothetical protein
MRPEVALQQAKGGSASAASLFNCVFLTTANLGAGAEPAQIFTDLYDAAMLGVGAGFDTLGAGKLHIRGCNTSLAPVTHIIADSREGSVDALRQLLHSFIFGTAPLVFDLSKVRPAGSLIRGLGGLTQGPALLQQLESVRPPAEARRSV